MAGGSNVLKYGNTRDLVLGVEIVLPSGEIMNLMSELHKDNSGYCLRDLVIGAHFWLFWRPPYRQILAPQPRSSRRPLAIGF